MHTRRETTTVCKIAAVIDSANNKSHARKNNYVVRRAQAKARTLTLATDLLMITRETVIKGEANHNSD